MKLKYFLFICCSSLWITEINAANDETAIDFLDAVKIIQTESPSIKASKANVQSQIYEHAAVKGLGQPNLLLTSTWGYYDLNFNINLSRFEELGVGAAENIVDNSSLSVLRTFLRPQMNNLNLPDDKYDLALKGHAHSNNVVLIWPLYTGGLITAVKNLSSAKLDEANANDLQVYSDIHHTLVERYFGAQLLKEVMQLRKNALEAIKVHDYTAKRMLQEGVISKVERMQANVALEDAKRNYEKSIDDSKLADLSLKSLLKQNEPVQPKTPLFILRQPLSDTQYFTDLALDHHPGLELVKAKINQAKALEKASTSSMKPSVSVIGAHEVTSHKPNKMVGVNVSWLVYSSVNRNKMRKSSQQKVIQAEETQTQARDDIALLIEKNWNEVEDARKRFLSLQSNVDMAKEYLRLRTAGLREGVNTVSDLIDAQVNYEKSQTEQLQAAYEYILALNNLATNTGQPELFEKFLENADTQLKSK